MIFNCFKLKTKIKELKLELLRDYKKRLELEAHIQSLEESLQDAACYLRSLESIDDAGKELENKLIKLIAD